jgi:hypothetical protein
VLRNVGRAGFFSISIVSSGVNRYASEPRSEYIYKIFSPKPIDHQFLSRVLGLPVSKKEAEKGDIDGTISWINHWEVNSYPYEYPRVTFDEIKLDEGLWYTSGIESFISTSKYRHIPVCILGDSRRVIVRNAGQSLTMEQWRQAPYLGRMLHS